jgi:hypothetical protein
MYNVLENSVILQLCLRHDIYNIIFKIKHELYSCPPPPKVKNFVYEPDVRNEDMFSGVNGSCKYSTEKAVAISPERVVHKSADWTLDNNYRQ